ncbi:class I SAM-dependent methyltransferase [Luteolibacter pohnpeiensis]|uniref:Class I SAM-dependent methyltransferase n=1 Tax=Luteolibacter pohnpeiensis TaxID=454153 RepID=A0A934S680_9BACT|nr:class I SAM-dependent methyltransferase [Luteolibacter pohnpeiensis]MBK1883840.1 class I SAM-dependent methyltransferase [Luteolibacter pohnpeiensis]
MSQPYLSLEAELHDAFWAAEDDASEVSLMAAFLKQHPGPALEIGCGSGRLLLPLLQQGHEIEGLELSHDMLDLAKKSAAREGLKPTLHLGDMTCWPPQRKYASLLAPAFTLQLADDALATLRRWHGWLEKGGGLYLTIFIPFSEIEGDQPENTWYRDHEATLQDGRIAVMETRHEIDLAAKILRREHRYQISGDSRHHQSIQVIRWYDPDEMSQLLEEAGYEIVDCFSDFNPPGPAAELDDPEFQGIVTFHARTC